MKISLQQTGCLVVTHFILLVQATSGNGQDPANLILNGDFENNSAPGEIIDASNVLFNFRMNRVKAIGDREGIDIQTTGIIATDSPQSGDWNIALMADENGNSEMIAMSLASPLDRDEPYQLDFFIKRLISLSHDGAKIEVGISSNIDSFGFKVFESAETSSILWQSQDTTFVAPINAKYLTVKVNTTSNSWVGIDNISLRHAQGELLLNGNFEGNNIGPGFDEQYALPHDQFNSLMHDVTSIGADAGLDILTLGGPIQGDEAFGIWKVAGGATLDPAAPNEAISMSLLEPVVAGDVYYVEFFLDRAITLGDIDGSGGSVAVGISTADDQIGTQVFQSPIATLGWTRHGTTFFAPNSGSYLTIEFQNADDHWLAVDNFSLRPFLRGDVNFDKSVDLLDVSPFVDLLTTNEYLAEADVNYDGEVNLLDVQTFVNLLVDK